MEFSGEKLSKNLRRFKENTLRIFGVKPLWLKEEHFLEQRQAEEKLELFFDNHVFEWCCYSQISKETKLKTKPLSVTLDEWVNRGLLKTQVEETKTFYMYDPEFDGDNDPKYDPDPIYVNN
jgi:hypothetical protein